MLPGLRTWLAAQEIMRLAALVAVAAFLADWASKEWALQHVTATAGSLLVQPTHNGAFAFSAGAHFIATDFVVFARLIALYALGVVFGRLLICDRRSALGFGLLLGGGIGNTADLAIHGAVLDFLNVGPLKPENDQ